MKDKTSDSSNIVDSVWRFFASMRLALFLIFLLSILSVVGTLIPQGREEGFYLTTYGASLSRWFVRLDLPDMYHSQWFSLLLAILALNIIVCTIERFPPKWLLFKRGERDMELTHIKEVSQYALLDLGNTSAYALSRGVKGILRSRAYRVSEKVSSDLSAISLKGHKGRLNRFGSDIVHLGIIVILLGGIIGSITGFKEYKPIPVGESVKIDSVDFDLHIRANKFWIENYESGEVKQYYSDLTIIDNGQEVLQNGLLYVNKPLIYKGIWLYQTSYGEAWDKVDDVTLSLFDRQGGKKVGSVFSVKWREMVNVPGLKDYAVKPIAFVADFAIDTANKNWYAKSTKHTNPAIQIELYKNGEFISKDWIFLNYPDIFPIFGDKSDNNLILASYTATPYTALNVVRDRGVNIVWAGCILMMLGLYLSFFVHHRRIWVIAEKKGKDLMLHLAGSARRDKVSFENEFKGIVEAIYNNNIVR